MRGRNFLSAPRAVGSEEQDVDQEGSWKDTQPKEVAGGARAQGEKGQLVSMGGRGGRDD